MEAAQIKSESNQYVKPPDEELRKRLSPLQYRVTQKEGTEPPFKNEYWDSKPPPTLSVAFKSRDNDS